MSLLAVDGLAVEFLGERGAVRAVDGISFELDAGEILGLVGESGSGKSAACLGLVGLHDPRTTRVTARSIRFEGRELAQANAAEWRALRRGGLAVVFQDPMSALNPYVPIGKQLGEVARVCRNATRRAARREALAALVEVGIPAAEERLDRYAHEFSGGMRQRVLLAMALLSRPRVLFADEPTTALDVTVQAQVLELLKDLRDRRGLAVVLVTHSLGVVRETCDRVQVLYCGRIVESARSADLFAAPLHPYTRGLLASVPSIDARPGSRLHSIPGRVLDPRERGPACAFAGRCADAQDRCRTTPQALRELGPGHGAACCRAEELAPEAAAPRSPDGLEERA